MKQRPAGRPALSEQIIRDIKRMTRKQYSAEVKIRVVLNGLRGVFPWAVRYGFGPHYVNLDAIDNGKAFLNSHLKMRSASKLLKPATSLANVLGIGPGMLAHNISCVLSKQA